MTAHLRDITIVVDVDVHVMGCFIILTGMALKATKERKGQAQGSSRVKACSPQSQVKASRRPTRNRSFFFGSIPFVIWVQLSLAPSLVVTLLRGDIAGILFPPTGRTYLVDSRRTD